MRHFNQSQRFEAKLLCPLKPDVSASWAFLVLPNEVSEKLPRRGRTTVNGAINGCVFQATLEPDGQLGHWLKVDEKLQKGACVQAGDVISVEIAAVVDEPEPEVPQDFQHALQAVPEAHRTWRETTTIARLDWIHWITSAKQPKTRSKRLSDACEMLASGKKRVCCFDQSGYYSKAFRAPEAAK